MTQPRLDVTLAMPPKPMARLTPQMMSAGRKCPTCRKSAKMWATTRKDSDHGYKAWRRLLEDRLRLEWWNTPPLNGPLRCTLRFIISRPQSRPTPPKTVQRNKLRVPNPRLAGGDFIVSKEDWTRGERVWCPRTPDLDRLTNSVFDALTAASVWWDDSQVVTWGPGTGKWYAAEGEAPSIYLRVEAV